MLIGGEEVLDFLKTPKEEADDEATNDDKATVAEVRMLIAAKAARRAYSTEATLGAGVWQSESGGVLLVNRQGATRWDGMRLERIDRPFDGKKCLDFDTAATFDFDQLEGDLFAFQKDRKPFVEAVERVTGLFRQWAFEERGGNENMPLLLTGLLLSIPVQTLFPWSPQVSLTGAAECGKSTLLRLMADLVCPNGSNSIVEKPSAAGLLQSIQNTARPALIDEIEGDHRRRQLMEILRSSSTGGNVVRGTRNQHGKSFGLRHIAVLSSIELDLTESADASRFLQFHLRKKSEVERGGFFLPSGREAAELRRHLLAASIGVVGNALDVIDRIRSKGVDGRRSRLLDCLSAPCAMLACLYHRDELKQVEMAGELVRMFSGSLEERSTETDEERLLADIMGSKVRIGTEESSISSLLRYAIDNRINTYAEQERCKSVSDVLATSGIAIRGDELFIVPATVSRYLLQRTRWDHKDIGMILKRLPGAKDGRLRINGTRPRCIAVPSKLVFCDTDEDNGGPVEEESEKDMEF